jgi:3,4-dihydroxy 2-butanone 4-phosphate synthase/GTP cyclohydrolase II
MRFLSNNPKKVAGIEGYGLKIIDWVPLQTVPTEENLNYLRTKRDKLGHKLDLDDATPQAKPEA